ncbi:hypothetical protein [Pelagibacterium limicola]|uniref:hypothetical protein n=1 Tax=Pelagibacterium limicola TaxID=2791022 RepID=UPI0018AF8851|nr:hypothetical protein [Pelagibacterium limicola]
MKIAAIAFAGVTLAMPAAAQDAALGDRNVFFFGGLMGEGYMHELLNPFAATYEDIGIMGAGYQQFFAEPMENFRVGLEIGAAIRAGANTTGEMWGGVVGRYDGFTSETGLRITPALTFGVSVVDNTAGVEARRAAEQGYPGEILFYLSPEISVSTVDNPDTEIFWRLHHRSGAWNVLGGGGSANATTIGFRKGF